MFAKVVFGLLGSLAVIAGANEETSFERDVLPAWNRAKAKFAQGVVINEKIFAKGDLRISHVKLPENKKMVLGLNPLYGFTLVATDSSNASFGLYRLEEPYPDRLADAIGMGKSPFHIGWGGFDLCLLELATDKDFQVDYEGTEMVDGESCSRFSWKRLRANPDKAIPPDGTFWVADSRDYALKKYLWAYAGESKRENSGLVREYVTIDGLVFPSRIDIKWWSGTDQPISGPMNLSYRFENLSDDQFYLPYYGFPDPNQIARPKLSRSMIVLLVLSGIAILFLIVRFSAYKNHRK
jgi:hypothetical protein